MNSMFNSRFQWLLLVVSLLQISGSLGEMMCEDLPNRYCAFAISSSGKRCVLESYVNGEGRKVYLCKTSEVVVERMSEYIETDDCVRACGVDRKTVGISSDALLEPQFISRLCSPGCYQNCPNIVDLYSNLAAGEGGYLPFLCESQRRNPHRAMVEMMSSGAAQGPISPSLSATAESPLSASSPFSGFSTGEPPVSAPSPFSGFSSGEPPASAPSPFSGFSTGEPPVTAPSPFSGFSTGEPPASSPSPFSGFSSAETPVSSPSPSPSPFSGF